MSIKIRIFSIGKNKESWLEEALQEYWKRLKPMAALEFVWTKDNDQLIDVASREKQVICLDPQGVQMTSEQFALYLGKRIEAGGSRVVFIIGGAEGLPEELKQKSELISLSKLTFTHQISRLILVEQIYRAFEIAKGSCYHK